MGGSYYVPRSVKGESRILFIFTVKSFLLTVVFGLIGALISYIIQGLGASLFLGLGTILLLGGFGYALGSIIIPDSPTMGVLRKAGGENLFDILLRIMTFKGKKKIYMYDYKRVNGGNK